MPNLIKQGEARVVTKNGEVFVNIALELTIKLDGSNLQVSAMSGGNSDDSKPSLNKQEKVNWEIPDFSAGKIDFGK
jgi:hypothetical protein